MSPDERDRQAPEDEAPAAPPPATWAGRKRAGAEADDEQGPPEDPRAGLTEEFDEVGGELEEELEHLAEPGADDEEDADELEDLGEAEVELDEARGEAPTEADSGERAEAAEEATAAGEEDEEEEEEEEVESDTGESVTATLDVADRERAEEAALAGLRARAAGAGPEKKPAPPVAPVAGDDAEPARAKPLWARFLAGSLLIVTSMATATAVSLLLFFTDFAQDLGHNEAFAHLRDQLEAVDGGDPQTILIIGSDERLSERGVPGRADTAILLRVDPDKDAIALLSIPRDLKVNIPGVGVDKFNVAYSVGGPELSLDVVKQLMGLEINHVVNINFTGFADAVNAIDCVYIDVDRRYFIPPEANYSEIDIEAGYQRLCGLKALQYVRYRYDDNDLVRSARQQDFLREARQKLPLNVLVRDRNELLDIFTEYTTSDISEAVPLLELLKTFIGVQAAPVTEVHFPADLGDGSSAYVTASEKAIGKAVDEFLGVEGTPGARPAGTADRPPEAGGGERKKKEKKPKPEPEGPPMIDAAAAGEQYAQALAATKTKGGDPMVRFPIFYPTRLVPDSAINDASRAFPVDGPEKEKYHGYKMVVSVPGSAGFSEYYGVSGTSWEQAPILENPSETREIDGREYLLFYDGDRLRLIGWKTKKAAYWVNNTLLQTLEEGELISIATSMRGLGG